MSLHPLDYDTQAQHPGHRPRRASSALLATRAWVQFILDFCHSVIKVGAAPPISWNSNFTPVQLAALRRRINHWRRSLPTSGESHYPSKVDLEPTSGLAEKAQPHFLTPRDLDTLRSQLLSNTSSDSSGSEPMFAAKYAYGRHTPSDEVQDLFARIAPRSSRMFLHPPSPYDPLLYHALDFQNALTGRALLLRVIAPWEVESSGDGLVIHGTDTDQLDVDSALGDEERKSFKLTPKTRAVLSDEVLEAVACAFYPAESAEGSGREDAIQRVQEWEASLRMELHPRDFADATRSLTDSLAAFRLTDLLRADAPEEHLQCRRAAAIWLRAALAATTGHADFDEKDRLAFYRPPRSKTSALEDVLTEAGCWYPEVP